MRIFKDLELVEQLGSGIPRILQYYGKKNFNFSENFLRMTFVSKEQTPDKDEKTGGQMDEMLVDGIIPLTKRQKEILGLINDNEQVSRATMAKILHINESAVQKHLTTLKQNGIIKRIGGTRGHWQINLDGKRE